MATKTSDLLAVAAPRTVALVRGVSDDQLDLPTPCPDYSVRDLLNHLYDVVVNFQSLAAKQPVDWAQKSDHLTDGWRDGFAAETDRVIRAWSDPAAVEGDSPGMGLPQATVGDMLLADLTVHAWDLARATGQELAAERATVSAIHGFMDRMGDTGRQMGAFGEPVPTSPDAPELDRLLGRTGRDPDWSPAT
jgi:uncharacterized protein (TIGR03086 family)